MHAALFRLALITSPLVAPVLDLTAQEPPARQETAPGAPRSWLVGASLGVPGFGAHPSPTMFTIGGHLTQLNVGRLGTDFAAGIVPRAVVEGILAAGARGGVALPVAVSPRMLLLPSAGVSLIGGVGSGGGAGATGLNAGITAVFLPGDGPGVRTGITWHRFSDAPTALWLLEFGFVGNPLRRPQPVAP